MMGSLVHSSFIALAAGAIAFGFEAARKKRLYAIAYTVAVSLFALRELDKIVRTYATHIAHAATWQWDYLCFWLYGRSLALHLEPYHAHSLTAFALPAPVDREFHDEILGSGILYPPWTLALFRPLGFFADPHPAAFFWCAVQLAALLASCFVIARYRSDWLARLPVVAALLFSLPPTIITAGFGQTIPLMLLLLALYVARSKRIDGGIWLALAAVVKPFVLVVFLMPLLRRYWAQVAAAFATLGVMSLAGMALAGPTVFIDYVRENPIARMPGAVLVEHTNVPLVAYFMRLSHFVPANSATLPPSMIAVSLAAIALGVLVAWVAAKRDPALAFSSLIALSLIVYPQSGAHYATLLILPLFMLREHSYFQDKPAIYAGFIAALYFLLGIDSGRLTIFATLAVWCFCALNAGAVRRAVEVQLPASGPELELAPVGAIA